MKKWFPSFNGPWWNSTSRGGAARPWSRISFHCHACHFVGWSLRLPEMDHSTASCEVEYCKSLEKIVVFFSIFLPQKKLKQLQLTPNWVFVFLSHFQIAEIFRVFLEPPHFYTWGVLRGACGDGYLGFRRPLWFGLIGFLLGKWWPHWELPAVMGFPGVCKGEDWISGLYTNWEHPLWDFKK